MWPSLNKILKGEGALPSRGPILTQEGTRIINIVKQLITDTIIQFGTCIKVGVVNIAAHSFTQSLSIINLKVTHTHTSYFKLMQGKILKCFLCLLCVDMRQCEDDYTVLSHPTTYT